MSKNKTTCDENRPTAEFDRFEFRGGRLIVGCKCTRNDGMQHECERLKCMADRLPCLTYPAATCNPSRTCPPRPPHLTRKNSHRDASRAESQSSHQVDGGSGGGVGGGTGVRGTGVGGTAVGGTGGEHSAERNARYRPFNSRRMRKWATDQYDDRPALRKFFRPCRVHYAQYRTAPDVWYIKMGCVSSKRKTSSTETNSTMFKVTNIDYRGNAINHGQIEITDSDLIMHYANEKSTISCPLSTIRRYGYEDFMFCFEAGRLSPYGQGIFAFRSKDADKIFNTIKAHLQISNATNMAEDMSSEVHFYSGLSPRPKADQYEEEIYDEVRFSGPRNSNQSIVESPYLELNPTRSYQAIYENMLNANKINNELVSNAENCNSYASAKEEVVTYTEVEIVVCKPKNSKNKNELPPVPPKREISEYTEIDFVRTRNLNNKNLFKCTSNSGTRRTRHDYGVSTP